MSDTREDIDRLCADLVEAAGGLERLDLGRMESPGLMRRAAKALKAMRKAESRGASREREACAVLAEGRSVAGGPLHTAGWHRACKDIASAIRARGQGEGHEQTREGQ